MDDASTIVRQSTERQVNVAAQSLMDWTSTRHPSNVTEDGVATLDDLVHYWGKDGQVCDFDITDVVLLSDADYMTLTFHMETLILGAHSPCLCSIQKRERGKRGHCLPRGTHCAYIVTTGRNVGIKISFCPQVAIKLTDYRECQISRCYRAIFGDFRPKNHPYFKNGNFLPHIGKSYVQFWLNLCSRPSGEALKFSALRFKIHLWSNPALG